MTATALHHTHDTPTSAAGSMYSSGLDAALAAALIATTLSATANTYAQGSLALRTAIAPCSERTATGPTGQLLHLPSESTAQAVMEIRRLSGLTWEELGDLFNVSRRSIHHWASGKSVTAKHERLIHRMVAAIRHLDRGDQIATRALLLSVDRAMGVPTLNLLRGGHFEEAMGRVEDSWAPETHRTPLSRAASDTRRPPPPALLLEAEQERPAIPAKARVARAKRTSKTMS